MKIDNEVKPFIDLITANVEDDAIRVMFLDTCNDIIALEGEIYSAYCKLVYDREFDIPVDPKSVKLKHLHAIASTLLSRRSESEDFPTSEITAAAGKLYLLLS